MEVLLERLARYARPLLLVVAGLLGAGAWLAVLGVPLIGWTVYSVAYVGLLVALPALVAVYRGPFDWFAWLSFGVLYVGLLIGLPVLLIVWGHYAANPGLREALMPEALTPLGAIAGAVTWIGFALFGWAAYRVRALPTAGAVALTLLVAAVFALPAELGWFATVAWGVGVLLAASALVWIAPLSSVAVRS